MKSKLLLTILIALSVVFGAAAQGTYTVKGHDHEVLITDGTGKFVAKRLLGTDENNTVDIAVLTLDELRRMALEIVLDTVCGNDKRFGTFVKSDVRKHGEYEATVVVINLKEAEVPMSPEEQARFQAWVKQWQPTPCMKDANLPMDTVRLQPGAESKIRQGYFFTARPAKRPDYVPTLYIPAKVLRNDGKFLGWQYFAPAQLKYLHEQ